ncbi:MAG: carboxypeptidase regulatory-like domain-containing protein [Phycisphaerae bacterium]|nr:carboxypeptidase regulatory-like domain-containing protein [Gemmatimonadaceae bacterium]
MFVRANFRTFCFGVLCAVLAFGTPTSGAAQNEPDVVRGKVTGDSGRVLPLATVIITRGPDRLTQQTFTDSTGQYSLKFEPGTGDYLVYVSFLGFKPERRRVLRGATERELVANFVLVRDLTVLQTVKVTAVKPVRASNRIAPNTVETGSSEKWADGVAGQLSPGQTGDLNALAGTIPGITLTPGGPSILGAPGSSNLTTLNGLALPGGSLPRAARTETRVTGATYDPTRGGFAGANIDVRLGPGDRFYQRRNSYFTLDAPPLQFTDAVGRSLGQRSTSFRGSLGADGELIRGALTYNTAVDFARSSSTPATLFNADDATLLRAGVSPDSVRRLASVVGPIGVPVAGQGIPTERSRNLVSWLGRIDDTRDSLRRLTLTTFASYSQDAAVGFAPLSSPASGGERRDQTLGAQFVHNTFIGAGRRTLMETRLAASRVQGSTDAYRETPGATVFVRSQTLDGQSDVSALTLGGSPFLANNNSQWTIEGANESIWNARGTRHRFKALAWARGDASTQENITNAFGSYTFNSLADLSANRPSSFSRTLNQPVRTGSAWNGALALAHQWIPSRWFNVLYGARVEGSTFGSAPARNTALEQSLGVKTGVAPTRVHVSPRIGFTWLYNREKENGSGSHNNNVGRFFRTATGTIRGGIGEFRDLLRPGVLADARAGTGLSGSTSSLSCVGAAVPLPNWSLFAASPDAIPTRCIDGSGALGERAPAVTLIDPAYDVPRSWRASLNWMTTYNKMLVKVDAIGSYDLSQPSTVDANFSGTPRFTLPGESDRPVFVQPTSIDPSSGGVSPTDARRDALYSRVGVRQSDLRGYGTQMTITLQPDVFKFRSRRSWFAAVSYTVQNIRQQFRGFDGATFGDPRTKEWAAGQNDARHAFVLQGGIGGNKVGTFTVFSRVQSGLPFTPVVQGDINGDGRSNDRAFIPNPAAGTDAALGAQLSALMGSASSNVRECLNLQLGKVAARNSCRGPWSQNLGIQWRTPLPARIYGHRMTTNVFFENPLGGLDQLLHGADGIRGWGTQAYADPTLLVARGFDASAKQFRYDVNPRFGDTRSSRTLSRTPFRITVDFSLDLSTDYDLQQLRRALEPVKVDATWQRRSLDSLASFYVTNSSSIHKMLVAESDSLFLSKAQVAQIRTLDSTFSEGVRGIYRPLAEYLATIPGGRTSKAALDSVAVAKKAYWKLFWQQPEWADAVVTSTQRELVPALRDMLRTTQKDRENSQWYIGYPVTLR